MRLLRSIKIRLVNYYYKIFPTVVVSIDELIYPHRHDITYRVDFIKNYILKSSSNYENSDYFKFLVNLNKHPYYIEKIEIEELIEKFTNLYFSIKNNGYQPKKYGYITVEKVNSKINFVYPSDGELIKGLEVKNKYFLREGAHRLAVLKALGYSNVKCKKIYRASTSSSDYSSFIKSFNYD